MKKLAFNKLPYLVMVLGLYGCHNVQPEEKAAYIGSADLAFCGGCGGWFVTVDTIALAVKKMHPNRLIARIFTGLFAGRTEKHTGIFVRRKAMESFPIPKENVCSQYFL